MAGIYLPLNQRASWQTVENVSVIEFFFAKLTFFNSIIFFKESIQISDPILIPEDYRWETVLVQTPGP